MKAKIGIEIHAQLNTESKIFCSCSTEHSDEPNSRTCDVCLGFPGSKPSLNESALRYACRVAGALSFKINKKVFFSRKTYFYPDLAKSFQITQFELPIGEKGKFKGVKLSRIHLEEDPASIIHPSGIEKSSYVLVDYNRSGIPLIEIVTEPDFKTSQEVSDFIYSLTELLVFLKVFDPKKCTIKADTNVSIEKTGYTRVEIKNIGSAAEIKKAIDYEIRRQSACFEQGKDVVKETRAWDGEKTISLRKKEEEQDYGYIYEPDLGIIDVSKMAAEEIKNIKTPDEAAHDLVKEFELKGTYAKIVASNSTISDLFVKCARKDGKDIALRWVVQELVNVANYSGKEIKIDEDEFLKLTGMIKSNKISEKIGKDILIMLFGKSFDVEKYVKENNLGTLSDSLELKKMCSEAINENKKVVEDYKKGKEQALNFFVGKVMRKSKGKADVKEVREMIIRIIRANLF